MPVEGLKGTGLDQSQLFEKFTMPKGGDKGTPVTVPEWTKLHADVMGDSGSKSHLYSLEGIEKQQSELAVKSVQPLNVVETRACLICAIWPLEGMKIGTQPIVPDRLQPMNGRRIVTHDHASHLELGELIAEVDCGFRIPGVRAHKKPASIRVTQSQLFCVQG
jgi:hypothetical protein